MKIERTICTREQVEVVDKHGSVLDIGDTVLDEEGSIVKLDSAVFANYSGRVVLNCIAPNEERCMAYADEVEKVIPDSLDKIAADIGRMCMASRLPNCAYFGMDKIINSCDGCRNVERSRCTEATALDIARRVNALERSGRQ